MSSKCDFRENQPSDNLATNFSCIVSEGGCFYIFVRNDKTFGSIAVFQFGLEKSLEPCAIRINLGVYDIAVCVSRSPSGSINQFLHLLDKLLHDYKPKSEFIFSGDMWCGRKVMRLATLCKNRQCCCLPLHKAVRLTPAVDSVQV